MIDFIRNRSSDERKMRLFGVACCLQVGPAMEMAEWTEAVLAAQQYAKSPTSLQWMLRVREALERKCSVLGGGRHYARQIAPWYACGPHGTDALAAAGAAANRHSDQEPLQAELVRCVFGNPFRSVVVSPLWTTPTIVSLAHAVLEAPMQAGGKLDTLRLGVLADALEESGAPTALLEHLRKRGPHVPGCHVIDLITGRQA
jgi:hypothetical protein